MMSVTLFKQNSAEDYVLRGFSQSEILDFTNLSENAQLFNC